MRKFLFLAGVSLALSACGGGGSTETNDANALSADNMMLDQNLMLDQNSMGDMNAMGGVDANGAVDANTANLMQQDANTNDPDTNLANGI